MVKLFSIFAMLLSSSFANAQKQDLRIVTSFSKIEVTDGIEVNYTTGNAFSVVVQGLDDNSVANITTTVKGNTLKIARTNSGLPVKVLITAPSITKIKATYHAKFYISNEINAAKVTITVSNGASVTGMVSTDKLKLSATGKSTLKLIVLGHTLNGHFSDSSNANIFGSVSNANFTTVGGAICNAKKLVANNITINAKDDSSIFINGSGKLDLDILENGKVTYSGIPESLTISSGVHRH